MYKTQEDQKLKVLLLLIQRKLSGIVFLGSSIKQPERDTIYIQPCVHTLLFVHTLFYVCTILLSVCWSAHASLHPNFILFYFLFYLFIYLFIFFPFCTSTSSPSHLF